VAQSAPEALGPDVPVAAVWVQVESVAGARGAVRAVGWWEAPVAAVWVQAELVAVTLSGFPAAVWGATAAAAKAEPEAAAWAFAPEKVVMAAGRDAIEVNFARPP
jgi:hypothetical protein